MGIALLLLFIASGCMLAICANDMIIAPRRMYEMRRDLLKRMPPPAPIMFVTYEVTSSGVIGVRPTQFKRMDNQTEITEGG
jgi:hypothetical protein